MGATIVALSLRPRDPDVREAAASARPPDTATPLPEEKPATPEPPSPKPNEVRVVRLQREPKASVEIALSPRTATVRLEVPVAPDFPSYDAVVRRADGSTVWRSEGLVPRAEGEPLVLTLPAEILDSDSYVLRVEGEPLRGAPAPRVVEFSLRVRRER